MHFFNFILTIFLCFTISVPIFSEKTGNSTTVAPLTSTLPITDCIGDEGKFLCKSGDVCLHASSVCDEKKDCPDGSDEFTECEKPCRRAPCAQGCVPDPDTKEGICFCYPGYTISGRNKEKCTDINECVYGACSHSCKNTDGSFECSCLDGFTLKSDNKTCAPIDTKVRFVYAGKNFVRSTKLKDSSTKSVVEKKGQPVGVSVDVERGYVFWTDVKDREEKIFRSRLNGSDVTAIVDTGLILPEAVAFDWIGNNIYFTDSNKTHIGVCNSNGTYCAILINSMDKPREIALHPNKGYMFWTDWGVEASVYKAGMDGSLAHPIITGNLTWPNGLAIDHGNERVYWTDAGRDVIESATLDGEDRRIIRSKGMRHPFGLDVFGDTLFWTDWYTNEIQSCNKFTGENQKVLLKGTDQMNGIVIYHSASQPKNRINECKNKGCSHICVLTPISQGGRCLCPVGMKFGKSSKICVEDENHSKILIGYTDVIKTMRFDTIGRDTIVEEQIPKLESVGAIIFNPINQTYILSDVIHKAIYEYDPNTKELKALLHRHIDTVRGIAIDTLGHNLYWTDIGKRSIEVMSFRTGARFVMLKEEDRPIDIVLVPESKIMFVGIVSNKGGQIVSMNMNGLGRRVLVQLGKGKGEPIALTYHRATKRLFWADAIKKTIEYTTIDGRSSFVAVPHAGSPYGLTSHGNRIYWTDRYMQTLLSTPVGIEGSQIDVFIGNKTELESGLLLNSYASGNFWAKLSVVNTDVSYLKTLQGTHQCSPDFVPSSSFKKVKKRTANKQCSQICLISEEDNTGTCACQDGMILDFDGATCNFLKNCYTSQFPCDDGKCIDEDWQCDGVIDCKNGEDEKNCTTVHSCRKSDFLCEGDNTCIPGYWRCDGENDCKGGEDERNCTFKCSMERDFQCTNGQGRCIPKSWMCDAEPDCPDGSDEVKELCEIKIPKIAPFDEHEHEKENLSQRNSSTSPPSNFIRDKRIIETENPGEKIEKSDNSLVLGILIGVLLALFIVFALLGAAFYLKRNGRSGGFVPHYIQNWVKYVNNPATRVFTKTRNNQSRDQLDGEEHIYAEMDFDGGRGTNFVNPRYEEIHNTNPRGNDDMQGGVSKSYSDSGITLMEENGNLYENDGLDGHYISFSQRDKLLDKEFS